jgi:arginyl-tRNA synthetase
MKSELEQLVAAALRALQGTALQAPVADAQIVVERTRDAQHGDYACNIAMRLAKSAGRPPRVLAEQIVAALPASPLVRKAEVAGAGFINFYLAGDARANVLQQVHALGARFGESQVGNGQKVLLEFVSANPTGPMHVGHGRQAAWGATLANLLAATGHDLQREYYINDAGRQVDILTASVWIRYLQQQGMDIVFPDNGYRGEYVNAIAAELQRAQGSALKVDAASLAQGLPPDASAGGDKEKFVDALIERMQQLLGAPAFDSVLQLSLEQMLKDIRNDLDEFGVRFDHWYSERELSRSGAIDRALARLEQQQQLYLKDGATWFRASAFGDDEDRVLVRSNGQYTYFAPDLAYHLDKRQRGFAKLIDVWGADHHGYVPRMRGGLVAMGEPGDCLEVCLIQFVSLFRGAEKVPMGKRDGQFVTLRQLREEVGNDACRLFYLMRSHDQHLDFDLELAKSRSNENPVYYIQYAHARVASVMQQLAARDLRHDMANGLANTASLDSPHEQAVLTALARYPEVVTLAALQRTPHSLVYYLRELATAFHSWYNASVFIVDEAPLRDARLALALGVQQVVRNGLGLLGVSAPVTM